MDSHQEYLELKSVMNLDNLDFTSEEKESITSKVEKKLESISFRDDYLNSLTPIETHALMEPNCSTCSQK